jgi:hypothetical protein
MQEVRYKEVDWHGLTLFIPLNHVAVAADRDGWVYSYDVTPTTQREQGWLFVGTDYVDICQVDLEGTDWRTTLVEYPL